LFLLPTTVRLLFCILLLICLPLQSFASQIAGVWAPNAASLAHVADHPEDLHHHHEDDGTIHYDESDESLQHAHEHSTPSQLLLLSPGLLPFTAHAACAADFPDPASHIPDPCLDEPQRPPAVAPGLAAGG
jgi:hypothetical protein